MILLNGIQNGFDIFAAAGGDGTVNEVASVLAGTQTQLGILPSCSGNGFAMHLGLGRDAIKNIEISKHGPKHFRFDHLQGQR